MQDSSSALCTPMLDSELAGASREAPERQSPPVAVMKRRHKETAVPYEPLVNILRILENELRPGTHN